MARRFARRDLLSFSFLRRRRPKRAATETAAPAPTSESFSLEMFYRERANNGVAYEAVPPLAVRVLPADLEDDLD